MEDFDSTTFLASTNTAKKFKLDGGMQQKFIT